MGGLEASQGGLATRLGETLAGSGRHTGAVAASTLNVRLSHPMTIGATGYPVGTVVEVEATLGRRLVFAGLAQYADSPETIDPDTFEEGIRDILEHALRAGDNISIDVNDVDNTITITAADSGATSGYFVWDSVTGTYPVRVAPPGEDDPLPGTYVGPVNPEDLAVTMVNGDVWINTNEDDPADDNLYVTVAELADRISEPGPVRDALATVLAGVAATLPQPRSVASIVQPGQTSVDEFNGNAVSLDWTRQDAGNPQRVTWKQGGGGLSFLNTGGDAAAYVHTLLRPGTLAPGEALETCWSVLCQRDAASPMIGICLATGPGADAAQVAATSWHSSDDSITNNLRQQTSYTVSAADGAVIAPVSSPIPARQAGNNIYTRLVKHATTANRYEMWVSLDGITWLPYGFVVNAGVFTHFGLWVSSWASTVPYMGRFEYLRKVAA